MSTKIFIVVGLGFGDEGKGSIVDWIARKYNADAVVRFNGGPQAIHTVISPDGKTHHFSSFGSATLIDGVKTHLSKQVLVKPQNIIAENQALEEIGVTDALKRLSIDPRCFVLTPYHAMLCQIKELARGKNRLGTTGMGIGEAVNDLENEKGIRISDFFDKDKLKQKILNHRVEKLQEATNIIKNCHSDKILEIFQHYRNLNLVDELMSIYRNFINLPIRFISDQEQITNFIGSKKSMIFEGAQGALLDYHHGFWPYVTKTPTTVHTAEKLIPRSKNLDITRIGVIRAYAYRLGPGPFVTENQSLKKQIYQEPKNPAIWEGLAQIGWFDLVATRYAIAINQKIDYIALTCLDHLTRLSEIKVCSSYQFESGRFGRIKISRLKKPIDSYQSDGLSQMLFDCQPSLYQIFCGWKEDISKIKKIKDLPQNTQKYLGFLQSKKGLGLPIKIVSVGASSENKISINLR